MNTLIDRTVILRNPIRFLVQTRSGCYIGDRCGSYVKSIEMTLDDILRDEIRPNMTLNNQPFIVKMSASLTMIMFAVGLIDSVLSCLTFQNKDLRRVGCGMYLLASAITSSLTAGMFTIKFWFVVITQMSVYVSLSVRRGGCVSIEPILKLFVYLNTWLNVCVAVERAVNVSKGLNFDKAKSRRVARWIIIILPLCIMVTIIHEPIYRTLSEYKTVDVNSGENKPEKDITETYAWCMIRYSPSVQVYNTVIQYIHLFVPFIVNLFSALFIIFGTARHRSLAQTTHTYREHAFKQLKEHKQLVISPILLLVLALPRIITSLWLRCVKASWNPWLYLCSYFISFIPSILIFVVFVLPSELYRKTFKESIRSWQRRIHR